MQIRLAQAVRARIDCFFRGHFWTEQDGLQLCAQCGKLPRRPIDLEIGF